MSSMLERPPSHAEPPPWDGTALAAAGDVWRGQRNLHMLTTAKRVHWQTALVGVVQTAFVAIVFLHGRLPEWRIAAQLVLFAGLMIAQRTIVFRTQHPDEIERSFLRMVALAQVYMTLSLALTGGIHSPLLPVLSIAATFPVVFFGPHRLSGGLLCSIAVLTTVVAFLPESITGPRMDRGHYTLIALASFGWVLFATRVLIGRIRDATERATYAIDCLHAEKVADTEEQMRRLQGVGAKVAHELKNPLAAIKGLVQLVARCADGQKTRERLDVVQSEIARMEIILAEYLSFSRPLEDLKPQSVDLAELASDCLGVVGGRVEQGRITVVTRTRPVRIAADPRRLKEALLNLLSNAIDATPAGGTIEIITYGTSGGGGVLEVRDTGRGIRPDDLERLGTSFFTTRPAGTGLGVVLAQGVVAQHGGRIHYASELGRGTQITVTLPARPQPLPPGAQVLTVSSAPSSLPAIKAVEAIA
jgi:signal transduction histidine kinase